jgi:TctA family transporter
MPPGWFVAALSKFVSSVYQHTGVRKTVTRVSLDSEFGIRLGILPGTSVDIATAAGYVEVYCERTARSYGTFSVDG